MIRSQKLPPSRLLSLLFYSAVFATWQSWWPANCAAQSSFNPPPTPGAENSQVRGLYNPANHITSPATIAPPVATAQPVTPTGISTSGGTSNAKPLEGGEIVARIDGQVVLASDLLWQVNKMLEGNADRIPPDRREEISRKVLHQQLMGLIDTKLLYADFRRTVPVENVPNVESNLEKPFEEHELPRLMKLFEVEGLKQLESELAKYGTSTRDMRRQFIERTIAGEWLRQKTPPLKEASREQLLEKYQEGVAAGKYDFPAKAQWEELMVRVNRFNGDRNAAWRAITEMGNEVWRSVAANPDMRGPAFAEVAVKSSHGFTAKEGGQHDWTTKGALRSDKLDSALFSLQLGQMSDIIETEQGFHIVRVIKRKEAGRTPFTEAQSDIRDKLKEEQRQQLVEKEVVKIREGSKIWTVFDGDLSGHKFTELMKKKRRR